MKRLAILLTAGMLLLVLPRAAVALPKGTRAEVWASGLDFAIDMAWVEGTKKVFVTEKSGAIRVIKKGRVLGRACTRLDVNNSSEQGLLGIALDPNFSSNKFLYVYYTNDSPNENRVARFKVSSDRCRDRKNIVTGLPAAGNHNGGQIEFVNGKLFISIGEVGVPSRAQDTGDRAGKILRYNKDGSIPNDNPFNNAVWSYGHRNPFGLAHKPGTGRIYSSENGPSCDDELNFIKRGRNYGWGDRYNCGTAGVGSDPKGPIVRWSNIIIPTDPGWYSGRLKALSGSLYMGDYGRGRLHRFVMNSTDTKVRKDRIIHKAGSGILDVGKGPGGWLYFMTGSTLSRIVKS